MQNEIIDNIAKKAHVISSQSFLRIAFAAEIL